MITAVVLETLEEGDRRDYGLSRRWVQKLVARYRESKAPRWVRAALVPRKKPEVTR